MPQRSKLTPTGASKVRTYEQRKTTSKFVNNFFKHLLLLNHWVNLDETGQGCSLGKGLQKFKKYNSMYNSGFYGNKKEKNAKSLKIFSSETRRRRAVIFGV